MRAGGKRDREKVRKRNKDVDDRTRRSLVDPCTMRRDLGVREEAGLRYGETRDLATAAYVT